MDYAAAKNLADLLMTAEEWLAGLPTLDPSRTPPRFVDPKNTWVDARTGIGDGTIVFPGCHIMGASVIGKRCVIFPHAVIINAVIGDDVIMSLPIVKNVLIRSGAVVGATAELNRTTLGERAKMVHHGYLGDTEVGHDSNIGAGTITANYDGRNKHKTVLGPGTFTGVNTNLIAPNEFPEGTYFAAGSTIPANLGTVRTIPPFSLIISRAKEIVIKAIKARKEPLE